MRLEVAGFCRHFPLRRREWLRRTFSNEALHDLLLTRRIEDDLRLSTDGQVGPGHEVVQTRLPGLKGLLLRLEYWRFKPPLDVPRSIRAELVVSHTDATTYTPSGSALRLLDDRRDL